ncbi:hypothetical protein MAPG_03142 [Magnaporthiopsis poae ATCC 64411]|uniref:Cell wall proline rich protein n=1 Tax=Magnaporthiopsis poae (strain ATCC 64411 / 73-15) TaxID=644358 RepID=A0A0C4DT82_MAGP6|nr:hypothetical protein MAPG_03142 [Magnaporthiopsis poae ATCC 64411]
MATAVGPDMPISPRLVVSAHAADGNLDGDNSLDNRPPSSPRSNPPPNPHFVFPARPAPSSAPSSFSRASGRRPKSLVDSFQLGSLTHPEHNRRKSLSPALPDFSFNPGVRPPVLDRVPSPSLSPALPDFKFNPGAGLASPPPALEHPFLSPPLSPHAPQTPSSPRAIPTRPGGGHRRGGSEFVGGQIRSGDAITVLGTSPTKSESGCASPQLKPANPRRGHAHRRSAAISSHDLSVILKPMNAQPRGSSAPNSPATFDRVEEPPFPDLPVLQNPEQKESSDTEAVCDAASDALAKSAGTEGAETKTPSRPSTRARVGFSDTLEFIPRPLSLVSSDTSSTMTARPGHSLSGSISSIISLTGSILEREVSAMAASPPRLSTDARPSTAGAILEGSLSPPAPESARSPQRRNSIPLLNAPALAAAAGTGQDIPSPSKVPKRWSFFGLEPFVGATSPTRTRPLSSSSSELTSKAANSSSSDERETGHSTDPDADAGADQGLSRKPSKKGNKKKKQKKVRTWAGSILTRKSKHRHARKSSRSRAQTPPPPNEDMTDEDSDGTTEMTIEVSPPAEESPSTKVTEWQARPPTPPEDDAPFPMIDLDAALGPFNTPLPRNAEWDAAQRASGLVKRPLHSAARLSPNMSYQHRRAESAPEMPPFNRAGIPRFSSNSTMADVFEEDEEDETKAVEKGAGSVSTTGDATAHDAGAASIDIRVTADVPRSPLDRAIDPTDDAVSSRAVSRKGSGLSGFSDDDQTEPSMCLTSEYSASSLHDEIIMEESGSPKWHGPDGNYSMKDDTSGSSTPSPRRVFKGKDLEPVDVSPLQLPTPSVAPVSPYSIGQSSSFSSPRSPMSYEDGNRISTAPSSVTEDNFQSLLMGEPGPEVRLSMDIPSLTSSNSTMTRESTFAHNVHHLSQAPVPGERPASFSSPFGRRGSLASIGRLISTSHGERSKLSIEVSLDAEEKKSKTSKAKRLSRLMQFWKPKESSSKA